MPRRTHHHHAGDFALPTAQRSYAPDLPLEPDHLDIFLHPDLDAHTASVQVQLTTISRTPGASVLTLDGVDFLDLTVTDPDENALSWSYDGDKIKIHWADGADVDEKRRVTLTYRVDDPINGLFFGGPDASEPDRGRYLVTDHETERARYWLACVDHPSARVTLDIRIRAPKDMEIVATGGLLGSEDHDDGTRTAHWRSEARCPSYLICLIVGEFVRCEDGDFDGKPLAYFALPPLTEADLKRSFGPTGKMLAFLTRKLGSPLPWAKYYQFAAPGIGGAMENISLVSWDQGWVMDARLHRERGDILDLVNLHEMAHTWFGDLLVIRDFAHAWLKESWATYLESVWLEETAGQDEMHYQLHLERDAYRQEADNTYVRPIVTRKYDSSWQMFDRHLYPGGAIRLHLLRTILGDGVFWDGVRDYVRDFANKTVETDDFRKALESRSGRYLARFFDQWLYSPGYPHLKASLKHDDGVMTLSVEQTQANSKKNIGLFSFPLTIAVEGADGAWSRHTIRCEARHHALRLPSDKKPLQVIVDPDGVVPHKLTFEPGQKMLKRILTAGPTVHARLYAAGTLVKSGRKSAILAVQEAFKAEPFWGVRVEMARALGGSNTAAACGALQALIPTEEEPRVQGALMMAAQQFRDPDLAKTVAAWLQAGDRPYRATGEALVAL
ncbi:MAG: M1 family metallopeptidase, partial [Myxococcota bacterium]